MSAVSILVVLDRAPQLELAGAWAQAGKQFQSLLSWIGLLNGGLYLDFRPRRGVSILVVLDRAPQPLSSPKPLPQLMILWKFKAESCLAALADGRPFGRLKRLRRKFCMP